MDLPLTIILSKTRRPHVIGNVHTNIFLPHMYDTAMVLAYSFLIVSSSRECAKGPIFPFWDKRRRGVQLCSDI